MIDLRATKLPDMIGVDGVYYPVYTDYRTWIEFERGINRDGVYSTCIFVDAIPEGSSWVQPALMFLRNPNSTPKATGSSERIYDFMEDGEFIVSSFQAAYGIDLTAGEYMHWHRFKALFDGLPDDTKMSKIISYRAYKKSSKKHDSLMGEYKQIWKLPEIGKDIDEARETAERLYELQTGGE